MAVVIQTKYAPLIRSLAHCGGILCAFPLTWLAETKRIPLGWVWASAVCVFMAVFNIVVLPRTDLGKKIRKENETLVSGAWLYCFALALCFLIYPAWAVGAAWAALAVGDALAVTIGSRIPSPKLPWNQKKSWAGLIGFIIGAFPACVLLLWWCKCPYFLQGNGNPEWSFVWTLAIIAAVSGAILESLDGPLDDNMRVPLGVGLVVTGAAIFLSFGTRHMPPGREIQSEWLIHSLIANGILGAAVGILKFVDWRGAIGGAILGTLVYFFAQPSGYALLLLFVVTGSLLSKVGLKKKTERNAAEGNLGKRGLGNVLANLLVPALCCVAYPATNGHPAALLAFACALCAAFADTASSEIGALSDKDPYLLIGFKKVPHGTNGAVSLLGYVGAAGICFLFVCAGWAGGFWRVIEAGSTQTSYFPGIIHGLIFSAIVFAAGILGTTMDSLLGATLEDRVPGFGKGAVNFFCTLTGAVIGIVSGIILRLLGQL